MVQGSQTAGVKPMSIAGRFVNQRERLLGMTVEERAFRSQWLKDQVLSHNEPREVPELYKATFNPIRRFYRWPLDQFENALKPRVGPVRAMATRNIVAKLLMGTVGLYIITYYLKYNKNDWTRTGGWRVISSRPGVHIGDAEYPKVSDRNRPSDYASRGFKNVELNL